MLWLCGIPLFFMETTLGQFGSTGCITIFRISPLFKGKVVLYLVPLLIVFFSGAGYAIVIVNIICTMYYNVVISYPLLFLANSLRAKLPWIDCSNSWNTENCLKVLLYNFHTYITILISQ